MEDAEKFRMSLNDCMAIFRNALIALIPSAERAHLVWQDVNPNDDWDRLAETLFDVFVARPVALDRPDVQEVLPLPRYDYDLEDYSSHSWIEVNPASSQGPLALVRLLSRSNPFDTVQMVKVNPGTGKVHGRTSIAWDEARFLLRRRSIGNAEELVDQVSPIE